MAHIWPYTSTWASVYTPDLPDATPTHGHQAAQHQAALHLSKPHPGVQTHISPSPASPDPWPALPSPPQPICHRGLTSLPVCPLTPFHLFPPLIPMASTCISPITFRFKLPSLLSGLLAYKIPRATTVIPRLPHSAAHTLSLDKALGNRTSK